MHDSVMQFLRDQLSPAEIRGAKVLEVGSKNINGSPREVVLPLMPLVYVGVDAEYGPGVDLVWNASDLVRVFGTDAFDTVISTEMLEHAEDWRGAIAAMKAVLNPGGLLILTTRSPGFPFHEYPGDFWRFTVGDFRSIFADMRIEYLESDPMADHPGVFFAARKTSDTGSVDLSKITVAEVTK